MDAAYDLGCALQVDEALTLFTLTERAMLANLGESARSLARSVESISDAVRGRLFEHEAGGDS